MGDETSDDSTFAALQAHRLTRQHNLAPGDPKDSLGPNHSLAQRRAMSSGTLAIRILQVLVSDPPETILDRGHHNLASRTPLSQDIVDKISLAQLDRLTDILRVGGILFDHLRRGEVSLFARPGDPGDRFGVLLRSKQSGSRT